MAGNAINIGSLLFDVGLDPAQVAKLTSDLRQVGREAKQTFERSGKAADPLTDRIRELNQRVKTLTEQYKAGQVTADQYRQGMGVLRHEFARTNKETGLSQKQMGDLAKGYRTAKAAVEPLKVTITEFRARLNSLREQVEAGTLSEKQFAAEARKLRSEIHAQIATTQKGSQQFLQLKNVLGTTTRSINSAEGQMSKLGIAAQVNIALNQRFANTLRTMGPAGSAAALGLTALGNNAGGLIPTFGVKLPAALQTTLGMLTTLQVLAPAAIGVGLVALTRFADKAADAADAIDKNSQMAGLSIEAYQELAFTFDQSGINADQFRQAMGSLNRRLGEAAAGNRAYADSYDRLGVSIRDANGHLRDSEEVMLDALEALGRLPSSAEQASLAAKLFGDDVGKKLVPVINQGADGIEDLRQKARDLGLVLSGDAVLSLVGYKDEMAALRQQFSTAGIEITASFLPILRDGVIPLLQEQVVPWVQSLAEGLKDVADDFIDAGVAGIAFRAALTDTLTPIRQAITLFEALGAGINLASLEMQNFGRGFGDRLGLGGNVDLRRALNQLGIPDSVLDHPLVGFPTDEGLDRENQLAELERARARFEAALENVETAPADVAAWLLDWAEALRGARQIAERSRSSSTTDIMGTPDTPTAASALIAQFQPRSTSGIAIMTPGERRARRLAEIAENQRRIFNESVTPFSRRSDPDNLADLVFNAHLGARAIPRPSRGDGGLSVLAEEAARLERNLAAVREQNQRIFNEGLFQFAERGDPARLGDLVFNAVTGAGAFRARRGDGGLSDLLFNQGIFQHKRRSGGGIDSVLSPEDRAFNSGLFQFRAPNRRGDGGLADAAEINMARDAIRGVQEQVDQLSGRAPSQFDQMRDAVEKFGLAAGKTPEEIADLTAEIDRLEDFDAFRNVAEGLRSIGSATGGPLGDVLAGMAQLVDFGVTIGEMDFKGLAEDLEAAEDPLNTIKALASGGVFDLAASGIGLIVGALGDLSDGTAAVREQMERLDRSSKLLTESAIEQLTVTRQVSRGGVLGWMGLTREEIFQEATELGIGIAEGIAGGLAGAFNSATAEEFAKNLDLALDDIIRQQLIEAFVLDAAMQDQIAELAQQIMEALEDGVITASEQRAIDIARDDLEADAAAAYEAINAAYPLPQPDPTGSDLATNPTGIVVPVAPTPVMAAPSWIPEFANAVHEYTESTHIIREAADTFLKATKGHRHPGDSLAWQVRNARL
jgi:hypothetical protein